VQNRVAEANHVLSVIALIPARGGSKAVPRKNLVPFGGKPLIQYTIDAAKAAVSVDRVILSSDDEEIASVARALGIEVPFLRPTELARDETPMIEVMRHMVEWLATTDRCPELLVLLQPTSPFRTSGHIDEAVATMRSAQARTLVSVVEVPHQFNPVSILKIDDGKLVPFLGDQPLIARRQDKPKVFARNGPAILITHSDAIREGVLYADPVVPYLMDRHSSLDIDTFEDLRYGELLLKQ
jgi:CMP-N,N'-diacetyllegionaminic acid synthase